ncbi:MAG: PepSY domain-containing protein [Gemmatimonadaceae bacterium]
MFRHPIALVVLAVFAASSVASAQAASPAKISKQDAALHAQAKVTEDAARAIALKEVPGATVNEGELEKENGKLIWSFDLKVAGKKGVEEVQVDAITGKVVAREHESDAKEAKEAKDEAAAKAKAAKTNAPVRKP